MKKTACLIISILMLMSALPVVAANSISVMINGEYIDFDQPPVIQDGRTLVPMRAIFEALGCEVIWYGSINQIDVYNGEDMIMNLEIGRNTINTQEDELYIDVPPQIINSRTLVPVRAISEVLGADVKWDEFTKTVVIVYTENNIYINDKSKDNDNNKVVIQPQKNSQKKSHPDSGNLEIYDDGEFKIVTLSPEESFLVTNTTESKFNISVEKNDYAKKFHYVLYKPDGNVETVNYDQSTSTSGNKAIKPGYTLGIYNPNDYEITIKGPSDLFYPEDKEAFSTVFISEDCGIDIENNMQTDYSVRIYGNEYDAKKFHYVLYKSDGNVETVNYDQSISTSGNKKIKPGYTLSIFNNNTDDISIIAPAEVFDYKKSNVFDIIPLTSGRSCSISNNMKTSFNIRVYSETDAKKFDYVLYDDKDEAVTTNYNQSINTSGNKKIKPGYSISISNSSDDTILVYVPENVY